MSRQIMANGKVEICAMKDGEQIRVAGMLVEDNRTETRQSMLDAYPKYQNVHSIDDENTQVFYLENVTAIISSFTHEPEVIRFQETAWRTRNRQKQLDCISAVSKTGHKKENTEQGDGNV